MEILSLVKKKSTSILSSVVLGLCPWFNLVQVFTLSMLQKKTKDALLALLLMLTEIILLYFTVRETAFSPNPLELFTFHKFHFSFLIVILTTSSIYSIYFSSNNSNVRVSEIFLLIGTIIFSLIPIFSNIIIIAAFKNSFVHKLQLVIIIILTLFLFTKGIDIASGKIQINQGQVSLLAILYLMSSSSAFFCCSASNENKKRLQNQPNLEPTALQEIYPEIKPVEKSKPATTPQPKPYNKGWTVDDTKQIDIRLVTIEDAISPLTLKNEYEKSAKDLILYIRKLEKHSDADIKNTLGNEGLSPYLEKFFSKMNFDAVRSAYIKSLTIVLENYSKRDNRVLPYLQKLLSIEKGSNLI